jgi:O-antigen/teichoic acid export membrane protein
MLLCNALLARLLSPQDLGVYFVALSFVSVGAQVGPLGANQAGTRFIAERLGTRRLQQARSVVFRVLVIGSLGSLMVGAVYYLFFGRVIADTLFHAPALVAVTGLVAGWMVVSSLQLLFSDTFRGFHDIRFASIFGGLLAWIMLAACLGLLWLMEGRVTLTTVLLLAFSSGFISVLLGGLALHRTMASLPRGGEDPGELKQILHVAWPLLVANLVIYPLTQTDIWILAALGSHEELAVYGAAAKLSVAVTMSQMVANAIAPPLVAEMHARSEEGQLQRILRTFTALTIIPAFGLTAGFVLFGGPLLGLIFGDFYAGGATALALLSLAQLVVVFTGPCTVALAMTGHQVSLMIIIIGSGVVTVLGQLLAVNRFGITGVAVATAAGLIVQSVWALLRTKATAGIWTHAGPGSLLELSNVVRSILSRK